MQTTITLTPAIYNKAKEHAAERHMTVDELLVMLISNLPNSNDEEHNDALWDELPSGPFVNPYEHTQEEIDARFDEIEKDIEEDHLMTDEEVRMRERRLYPR